MRTPSNRTLQRLFKLRQSMATPLLTKEQRGKLRGRAFAYARKLLLDPDAVENFDVGRAPYSHIDAETIAQKAYTDGYIAALRDSR